MNRTKQTRTSPIAGWDERFNDIDGRIALAKEAERNRRKEAVVEVGIAATKEHKEHKDGNEWRELVVAVSEILNRGGGSGDERALEARIVLAGAQRLLAG